jgi:hypothetical protein
MSGLQLLRQEALGRAALAIDLWSTQHLSEVCAITLSYTARNQANGQLELRTFLLSFDHFEGDHSGKNMAKQIFEKLKKEGLLHYVSVFRSFSHAVLIFFAAECNHARQCVNKQHFHGRVGNPYAAGKDPFRQGWESYTVRTYIICFRKLTKSNR